MHLTYPIVDNTKVYSLGGEPFLYVSTIIFDTGRITANLTPLRSNAQSNLLIPWETFLAVSGAKATMQEIDIPYEWYEKIQDSLDGDVQKLSNIDIMGQYIWLGNIPLQRVVRAEKLGF